jgi:hypothetical protein
MYLVNFEYSHVTSMSETSKMNEINKFFREMSVSFFDNLSKQMKCECVSRANTIIENALEIFY